MGKRQELDLSRVMEVVADAEIDMARRKGKAVNRHGETLVKITFSWPQEFVDDLERRLNEVLGRERTERRPKGFGDFVRMLVEIGLEQVDAGNEEIGRKPVVTEYRPVRRK